MSLKDNHKERKGLKESNFVFYVFFAVKRWCVRWSLT